MHKYTKAILAFAGVLLPFLESVGAPLPAFLTLDWVQGVILALTPVLVYYFPNTDKAADARTLRSPAAVGVVALLTACLALSSCGILGQPAPESFNDRVGYALGTHTAVLQSTTTAVTLGDISSEQARDLSVIADKGRAFIDTSRRVYSAGDVAAANRNLALATSILQELQIYLRGANP